VSPEELDKARWDEATRRAPHSRTSANPTEHLVEMKVRVYRHLVVSNWQPTPKPSPRVMAMREWLRVDNGWARADSGSCDGTIPAISFLAGYAAAVKEAEPIVARLKDRLRFFPIDTASTEALTTYLTAIGE